MSGYDVDENNHADKDCGETLNEYIAATENNLYNLYDKYTKNYLLAPLFAEGVAQYKKDFEMYGAAWEDHIPGEANMDGSRLDCFQEAFYQGYMSVAGTNE